jgi:hypothetical protein
MVAMIHRAARSMPSGLAPVVGHSSALILVALGSSCAIPSVIGR